MSVGRILDEQLRAQILELAARHGASNVRLFGSFVRNEAEQHSDFDLLVDFEEGRTLLDQVRLILEMEELLKRRVDVATYNTLHESIRDRVLTEAMAI